MPSELNPCLVDPLLLEEHVSKPSISPLSCVSQKPEQVPLADVLITSELDQRIARKPDHQSEARALVELAETLATSPNIILQKLADVTLTLCHAECAGVSIAERDGENEIFRWRGVAGKLSPFIGGTMPRHFSPCGVVVDSCNFQLMKDLDGHYQYCDQLGVALGEVLLIPFLQNGLPVGTLWAVAHGQEKKFDAEDLRVLKSLSSFASAAFQTLQNLERERAISENEMTTRKSAESYDAVALLRQKGYVQPVIALTAHAMRDERDRCLAAGFSEYLAKPIDRNAMVRWCARWVDRTKSAVSGV